MEEDKIYFKIDEFITEGINITRSAQEKDAVYQGIDNSDFEYLLNVFKKYNLWKYDLKKALNHKEICVKIDISVLFESNSIPNIMPGGIMGYRNSQSEEYQNFLKNIREETHKILEWLRLVKDKFCKYPVAKYKNGILYFQGKEIDFNRKQNQKDLLIILFGSKEKKWAMDEIMDKWDETQIDREIKGKNHWRTFNSAAEDINNAIAIETQVKNFIIKTTKEMQINQKYI